MMNKALIIGCGLSGAVIGRELSEKGVNVTILERRNHIGGNMFDEKDSHGVLVHRYGPHTFHTNKRYLFDYMCKYADWDEYHLLCGAEIDGICTPTPFNFKTIEDFFSASEADSIKKALKETFPGKDTVTVVEALSCDNELVRQYANFLFEKDYSLYAAKQWGVSPDKIDPSVLERVPLRLDHKEGYFDDEFQVMPKVSFTAFFENLLNHPNISVKLETDALEYISVNNDVLHVDGKPVDYPVIYTGPLDELFDFRFGQLPYRSLRFEFIHEDIDSKQPMAVVAYPQAKDFIRIIEYKKLPVQEVCGTTYEVEYSLPYNPNEKNEPYYPVLTEESSQIYSKYSNLASRIPNLFVCGRLGLFKYYNMDQALESALNTEKMVWQNYFSKG